MSKRKRGGEKPSKGPFRDFLIQLDGDSLGFIGGDWLRDLRARRPRKRKPRGLARADNPTDEDAPDE